MVQIQVTGPLHSKKGYIMVAITKLLRELGAEVTVMGETTHLAEKVGVDEAILQEKITGQVVQITELQTSRGNK